MAKKENKKKEPKFVLYDLKDNEAYLFDDIKTATEEAKKYLATDKFDPDEYIIAELKVVRRVKSQIAVIDSV